MLCFPTTHSLGQLKKKKIFEFWTAHFPEGRVRASSRPGLPANGNFAEERMLWSVDPNKPVCKLAGGIDPVEIKGLIWEHLKKLLRCFY